MVFAMVNERQFGDAHAVAVAVCGVGVVLARLRWPAPALGAGTAATAVTMVAEPLSPTFVLLLGLLMYNATLHTTHRRSWLYSIGVYTLLLAVGLIAHPDLWWNATSVFTLFAWICGTGAIGDAIRNRRALLTEMAERVRQAELTRDQEVRRRVMDERLRIARELHDVVAHHIAVINVQAGAAGHVIEQHPEQAGPVLEVIRHASDNVLREIRSVVGVLRDPGDPGNAEPSPSLTRLPELVQGLTATGFRIDTHTDGDPAELPAIVDQAAYRIAQEALTNAHRYGDGQAELVLAYTGERVTVEVTNRLGRPRPGGSGFGLLGMRERAAAVGGSVSAGPTTDGRFRLHATLPTSSYELESTS
ncbi:two-component sensor histidine kinase [Actinoplanes teichomyceticus]|nr:two-component sensor histidine kinase [Actinoplanes teichomyceticus]